MPRRYVTLPTLPAHQTGGEIRLRCPACGEMSSAADLAAQALVCGWCDFHFPLEAGPRLDLWVDEGSFRPLESAGGARFGWAALAGRPLAVAVSDLASCWDAAEIGALAALAEEAARGRRPLLWAATAAQGGADSRRWPGLQIALDRLGEAGEHGGAPPPWIVLLSGPVYGPVAALAVQADLVLAEPGTVLAPVPPAALRRAGRLPAEAVRSPRRLLREGWADAVLPRRFQRAVLADLLDMLGIAGETIALPPAASGRLPEPFRSLFTTFHELSGDRQAADDPALIGGLARLAPDRQPVIVLATTPEGGKARRRASAVGAAGWRKATRLLRLAARFGLPVVLLVDGPTLRAGWRDDPAEITTALGETAHMLLTLPVPTIAVHTATGADLAGLVLALADALWTVEDLAPHLREADIPVNGVWGADDLAPQLARVVRELQQTYLSHGPLGRRALLQRRYVRWTRLAPKI